jgi:hypothetical protein
MGTAQPPNSQIPKELIAGIGFLSPFSVTLKILLDEKRMELGGRKWTGMERSGSGWSGVNGMALDGSGEMEWHWVNNEMKWHWMSLVKWNGTGWI